MAVDCGRKYKMLEKKHALKETVLAYKIALKSKMMGKPVGDRPVYIAMIDGLEPVIRETCFCGKIQSTGTDVC